MDVFGINIPDKLNKALLEDDLVIFAGAGVSKQSPCSLGTFMELVEEIAADVDPFGKYGGISENETCEAALGRLSAGGDIYRVCAGKIAISTCSELHKNILSLFEGDEKVRVVTTNFDKGFSNASEELRLKPRLYEAPALPLGTSFNGLIHLHGSVDHPYEMVLTDSDFGRAYVSNGWAARFLVDMFSTYTVLFVGYSCSDMLVRYLTRSISTEMKGKVFALERDDTCFCRWQSLGIEPIKFGRYDQLPALFDEWSRKTRLSLYERANTVREMAVLGDKLDEGSRAELRRLLSTASEGELGALAKAYAAGAEELGSLSVLSEIGYDGFMYEDEISSGQFPFFDWALKTLAVKDPCGLLLVSAKKKQHFSKNFCRAVLQYLAVEECTEECIAAWVSYFEPQWIASGGGWFHLTRIIEKVKSRETSLRLAKFAFSFFHEYKDESFGSAAGMVACPYFEAHREIERMRKAIFIHFDDIGEELFDWLIGQFEEIARIDSLLWTAESWFDGESFSRSAIEDHEQDSSATGTINAMISIARDLGIALLEKGIKSINDFKRFAGSKSDLVVRIGLFLMERGGIDGDAAIETVMSGECFNVLGAKHEVYSILKYAYPRASLPAKKKLIAYICERHPDIDDPAEAHSRFSLFSYLLAESSNDPLLLDEIEKVKSRFPNFKLATYPDLVYSVTSGWEENEASFEICEAGFTADAVAERWNSADEGESRFLFGQAINNAMRKYPDKAIEICLDLVGRDGFENIVSKAFLYISWAELSASLRQDVVELLSLGVRNSRLYPSSIYAVKELSKRDNFLSNAELEFFADAGINGLDGWLSNSDLAYNYDWLTTSINCPIGQIASVLVGLSKRFAQEEAAEGQRMISGFFIELLKSLGENEMAIRCIAASFFSEANYWASTLPEFFSSDIAPLFGKEASTQGSWCGFSYLGWISEAVWRNVREYWRDVVSCSSLEKREELRRTQSLFFWASIQYDDPVLRDKLFRASFKNPQVCSRSTWILSEWTVRLSGQERMLEWNKWIRGLFAEALDSEENYYKSARHVGRLLDREKNDNLDIAADVIRILASHCDWECEQIILSEEELPSILENDRIPDETKVLFLLAQLNSTNPGFSEERWYRMSASFIDFQSLEPEKLSRLRDAFVRYGFDVPEEMVDHDAFPKLVLTE